MPVSTATSEPIAFRSVELGAALATRTAPGESLGLTAKRDLGRYYAQLDAARTRAVQGAMLTTDEVRFIVAVTKGKTWDAGKPHMLWAEVADADPTLAIEHGVNSVNVERRLRVLSHFELLAILDACERFWLLPERQRASMDFALRLVGLLP